MFDYSINLNTQIALERCHIAFSRHISNPIQNRSGAESGAGLKKQKSRLASADRLYVDSNGRCERIRTFDPLHPMQVRYQAAPHTVEGLIITPRAAAPQ